MLQKIINKLIYLVVFCLPLYLVSFKVFWIPTNVLEILMGILFVFWLVYRLREARVRPLQKSDLKFWMPIFLIFLGITISVWLSSDLEVSAGIWKSWFVIPMLFFVIVLDQIKKKDQVKKIIISLTLSGLAVALIALYYWLNGNLTYDGRLNGFYLSANYLAMYLSPILILSLYLYSVFDKKIIKLLLFTVHCLLFIVLYLTYSYGAWLGLLVAFIFILLKQKNKKILLIFLLLVILVSIIQIPSCKFQGFWDFSYPSLQSRLVIWQSAFEILKDNSVFGIGLGMFQKYYLAYQDMFLPYPEWAVPQPHNIFLAFWLQTGLLGFIGFIWLLVYFFKKTNPSHALGLVLMGFVIYFLIHGLIDTTYFKNDLSVMFWLAISLGYKVNYLSD